MQHPKMWIHEDKLSKTLMKNVCLAVKYIQNMSLLKEFHQLNIMDIALLHRTQRHVFQINCMATCIKSEIMAFLVPI